MLPSDWSEARYGEVAEINRQSLGSATDPHAEIQYLDIGSITSPGVVTSLSTFRFGEAPSRARRVVRSGDTVVSTVRPYLRAFAFFANPPTNLIASTGFAVLSPGPGIDPGFLYQSVLSDFFVDSLKDRMKGSNYPAVNASDVAGVSLPLPPLPEQRKIAAILGSVDEAIRATLAVIEQTRTVKQGLLQELLTRGIGHTRFKQTEVGEVPECWEVVRLESIFTEVREPGTSGLPVMSVTMADGIVEREALDRRVVSDLAPESHLLARQGDLVYNTMRMWQGVNGIAPRDCIVSPAYVVCRPSARIDSGYAGFLFRDSGMVRNLAAHSQGLTDDRLRLYYHHFAAIRAPLPPLDEQRRIAAVLKQMDSALATSEAAWAELDLAKRGLMQDLLTGRVRVSAD